VTRARALAALALGAAATVAAHAAQHITDITWSADGGFVYTTTVAPGRFAELCGKLDAGHAVRWRFDAAAPLDFNIHYHVGKDVVYPVKATALAHGTDTLDATLAQEYCWMWTNRGTVPVRLEVSLQRGAR
jgi:hypothetical protein